MTLNEFAINYKHNPVVGNIGDNRVIFPCTTLIKEMGFYTLEDYMVWSISGKGIILMKKNNEDNTYT